MDTNKTEESINRARAILDKEFNEWEIAKQQKKQQNKKQNRENVQRQKHESGIWTTIQNFFLKLSTIQLIIL